jgi:hypothetical protein
MWSLLLKEIETSLRDANQGTAICKSGLHKSAISRIFPDGRLRPGLQCGRPLLVTRATSFAAFLLIGREHETARRYDYVEVAIEEWKIFRVAFLPCNVGVACILGTSSRDGEKLRREVNSRDRSSACARHECRVTGAAGNVEHSLVSADTPDVCHVVGDCLDATGNLVVIPRCPNCAVLLF